MMAIITKMQDGEICLTDGEIQSVCCPSYNDGCTGVSGHDCPDDNGPAAYDVIVGHYRWNSITRQYVQQFEHALTINWKDNCCWWETLEYNGQTYYVSLAPDPQCYEIIKWPGGGVFVPGPWKAHYNVYLVGSLPCTNAWEIGWSGLRTTSVTKDFNCAHGGTFEYKFTGGALPQYFEFFFTPNDNP